MAHKDISIIHTWANQAGKAAKVAERYHSRVETYVSFLEAKAGKVKKHTSVTALFKKLGL